MSDFKLVKLIDPIQLSIAGTFTPKGVYNPATDYVVGDQVSYNGSSYIMYVDAAAGTLPTDATKWGIVASKGDAGAAGTNGVDGADSTVPGPAGDDGVGIPVGGSTGQVLAKNSGTDYDTEWVDPTASHTHPQSDITNLVSDLAAKLDDTQFSGLSKITVGTTAPSSPSTGDLWVDTN